MHLELFLGILCPQATPVCLHSPQFRLKWGHLEFNPFSMSFYNTTFVDCGDITQSNFFCPSISDSAAVQVAVTKRTIKESDMVSSDVTRNFANMERIIFTWARRFSIPSLSAEEMYSCLYIRRDFHPPQIY